MNGTDILLPQSLLFFFGLIIGNLMIWNLFLCFKKLKLWILSGCFFKLFYVLIYLFLEREEGREKERERNINVREKHQSVTSCPRPHREPNPQPRYVPRQELNQPSFTLHEKARLTEPHQTGLHTFWFCVYVAFLKPWWSLPYFTCPMFANSLLVICCSVDNI